MPSKLSSTGATCGSGCRSMKSSPPKSNKTSNNPGGQDNHSNSPTESASITQHDDFYNDRIISYLADAIHEVPHFDESLIKDNIHATQMKAYLDNFDTIMGSSDH